MKFPHAFYDRRGPDALNCVKAIMLQFNKLVQQTTCPTYRLYRYSLMSPVVMSCDGG